MGVSAAGSGEEPNRIDALNQNPYPWLRRADLGGTFVFAVEGAMAGVEAGLDLFGVLVLSFVTALGGGIVRDLLIGAAPPAAIRDWRYATTAFSGGTLAFLLYQVVSKVPHPVLIALSAGLALFAVGRQGARPSSTPSAALMEPAPAAESFGTSSSRRSRRCSCRDLRHGRAGGSL